MGNEIPGGIEVFLYVGRACVRSDMLSEYARKYTMSFLRYSVHTY